MGVPCTWLAARFLALSGIMKSLEWPSLRARGSALQVGVKRVSGGGRRHVGTSRSTRTRRRQRQQQRQQC